MVQELLDFLPRMEYSNIFLAILAALCGVGLWLFGSRINRALMCLGMVSVGAGMGMHMPHWFGWSLDGWASALGLAALMGMLGFMLHEFWSHVAQILLLCFWAAAITWIGWHGNQTMSWPSFEPGTSVPEYFTQVWHAIPWDVRRILPFTCGAALIAGAGFAIILARFSTLLFHSGAGVTLMVLGTLLAMKIGRPQMLHSLPSDAGVQVGIMVGLIGIGMLVQQHFFKSRKKQARTASSAKSAAHARPSME